MAVFQNPVLTDGWWVVKETNNDWGRGLGLLTDGWWFPECLPLDILYYKLGVAISPELGMSIMDKLNLNMEILKSLSNVKLNICKEIEKDSSINQEEEINISITKQLELKIEG